MLGFFIVRDTEIVSITTTLTPSFRLTLTYMGEKFYLPNFIIIPYKHLIKRLQSIRVKLLNFGFVPKSLEL